MDYCRYIRITILSSVLLAFALLCNQCLPMDGSSGSGSAVGCGSGSTSSLTIEDTSDTGLDAGGPIDIPVTISKNIDGVDATSVTYTPLAGSSLLKKSAKILFAATDTQIGIVKFYLKDHVCGTVLVIKDNEITEVLTSDLGNDCIFSDYITAGELYESIAYTAVGPATTTTLQDDGTYETNGGDVSPIVIGIVKEPDDLVEDYEVTVITTNLSSDSELELTIADDAKMAMATTSTDEDILTFLATDADGSNVLASIEENGGEPEVSLALAAKPDWLLSTRDEIIQLTTDTATTGTLFDSDLNVLDDIVLDYVIPGDIGSVALQPGGNALAYAVPVLDNDQGHITMGIGLVTGLLDGEVVTIAPKLLQGVDDVFETIELSWTNSFDLVAVTKDMGTYKLWTVSLAEAVTDELETLPNTELYHSAQPLSQVQVANALGNTLSDFYFLCGDTENAAINNLCRITVSSEGALASVGIVDNVVDIGYSIDRIVVSPDRVSYATLSLKTDPPSLCFLDLATDDLSCSAYGIIPVISPANSNVVGYIADLEDTNQVGIYNVDNNLVINPEELSFAMSIQTIATSSVTSHAVKGGYPPYQYSIINGNGSIDEDTGIFIASTITGTTQIRVTDTAGSTQDKTIHLKNPGTILTDWASQQGSLTLTLNRPPSYPGHIIQSKSNKAYYVLEHDSSARPVVFSVSDGGQISTDFGTNGRTELTGSTVSLTNMIGRKIMLNNNSLHVAGDATYTGGSTPARKAFLANLDFTTGELLPTTSTISSYQVLNTSSSSSEYVNDALILVDDGSIYFAGLTTSSQSTNNDLMIMKTNSLGLDTSYGTNGLFTVSNPGNDSIKKIVIDDRFDEIYFIGTQGGTSVLGRVNNLGTLDTTFASSGFKTNLFPGNFDNYTSLVLDNEHRVVYIGGTQINNSGYTEWAVARVDFEAGIVEEVYTATNTTAGFVPQVNDLCLDHTNRKILAVMQSSPIGNSQWYMVRLLAAGGIDTTFGSAGISTIDPTVGFDSASSCTTDSSGSVVLGNIDGAPLEDNAILYRLIF